MAAQIEESTETIVEGVESPIKRYGNKASGGNFDISLNVHFF